MPHGLTTRDERELGPAAIGKLSAAADDLRMLLGRTYGMRESLQLVGNHFKLTKRQRQLLYRCISSPPQAEQRRGKLITPTDLAGAAELHIDGYNCLIVTECCLAGGIVFRSDDGVLRDIEGVFGAFRVSEHTEQAIRLLTDVIKENPPQEVRVCLDDRMRHALAVRRTWENAFADADIDAKMEMMPSADNALQQAPDDAVIASSDREVMDAASHIIDLPRTALEEAGIAYRPVELRPAQ